MIALLLFVCCLPCRLLLAQSLSIDELWNSSAGYEKARQSKTSLALAELNVNSEQLKRLPLIYGEANLQRNLIIPATPVPALAFDPNASPGDILPLKFATNWSSKAGVQFSIDLYNPQRARNIKTARIDRRIAELDYANELLEWKKNATGAYVKVILSSNQYQAALEDSVLYSEIVRVVAERVRSGRVLETELNRARQELINRRTLVSEAYQVMQLASIDLSRYVDTERFHTLSSPIDTIIARLMGSDQQLKLRRLALNREQIDLEQANLKREALPTFSMNAFYGSQYFGNQLRLLDQNDWFGNSYINLGIRLPISEAVDRGLKRKRLILERQRAESQYREQQQLDSIARREQETTRLQAPTKLANARQVEALSAKTANILRNRYQSGKILLSELNEELSAHFKNKQNVWQAENDYVQALLDARLR